MFEVHGGVFTDMSFREVVPGTEESYGPFETRDEAVAVWRGKMGYQIDTCEHRLFVIEVPRAWAEPVRRERVEDSEMVA